MIKDFWPAILLFLLFTKIGAVSFGGAYTIWALIDQEFSASGNQEILMNQLEPLSEANIQYFMQVAHLTPGPNISGMLLIGNHYFGLGGIGLIFIALLLPSAISIILLYRLNFKLSLRSWFLHFKQGALAAVIGILIYFMFQLSKKIPVENFVLTILFAIQVLVVLYLVRQKKVNGIFVTFGSGLFSWLVYFLFGGF